MTTCEEGLKILKDAETEFQKIATKYHISLSLDDGKIFIHLRADRDNRFFSIMRRELTPLVPF
jgi:hypothetical protein